MNRDELETLLRVFVKWLEEHSVDDLDEADLWIDDFLDEMEERDGELENLPF